MKKRFGMSFSLAMMATLVSSPAWSLADTVEEIYFPGPEASLSDFQAERFVLNASPLSQLPKNTRLTFNRAAILQAEDGSGVHCAAGHTGAIGLGKAKCCVLTDTNYSENGRGEIPGQTWIHVRHTTVSEMRESADGEEHLLRLSRKIDPTQSTLLAAEGMEGAVPSLSFDRPYVHLIACQDSSGSATAQTLRAAFSWHGFLVY